MRARFARTISGWAVTRHAALLLALMLFGIAPGEAYALEPEEAAGSAASLLAIPDDAGLGALAGDAVDDSVVPYEGAIDMATLQEDALERLAMLVAEDHDQSALALALEFDPAAAFAFVRDRIGFDPYRGLLRGAAGTLAARAGNSLDRAVLLREILGLMGVPTRLAFAELTETQVTDLVERSFRPPVRPLPAMPPEVQAPLDWEAIAARAGRDYGRVRQALGERIGSFGSADRDAAIADVGSHAWVQAFVGTAWVDLDPTMPDARLGERLAEPSLVADEVPSEEIAGVSISLVAQTYDGQAYRSSTVLSEWLPAWQAAESQILLSFQPEFGGVGGSILAALGEAGSFVPHLAVAGTDHAGQPFPVRRGTDIFSGALEGGPEVARLRLDLGMGVPGRTDVVVSRLLLDRLPDGTGTVADGQIAGLELLPLATDQAGPIDLQTIRHILFSTGGASPWASANDRVNVISFVNELLLDPDAVGAFDFDGQMWPVTVANEALVLGAERSTIATIDLDPRIRAFVAEPRVYIVSFGGRPDLLNAGTDIVHDPIAVLEEPGSPTGSAARAELWYGAVQAAAETEFLVTLMSGFGGGTVESVSTASADELAAFDDVTDAVSAGAPPSLIESLGAGQIAIVPGEPSAARGWWLIDPRDGTTRSVNREGRGYGISAGVGRGGRPISTPSGDPGRFQYKPTGSGTPAPTCTAANEYTTPIGCVSLPGALAFWGFYAVVTLSFAWSVNLLWQDAIGYQP